MEHIICVARPENEEGAKPSQIVAQGVLLLKVDGVYEEGASWLNCPRS
jgi:hypothetical protein